MKRAPTAIELAAARVRGEAHPLGGWTERVAAWQAGRVQPKAPIKLLDIAREVGIEQAEAEVARKTLPIRHLTKALRELGWMPPVLGGKHATRTWTPPGYGKSGPRPKVPEYIPAAEVTPAIVEDRRGTMGEIIDAILERELFDKQLAAIRDRYARVALFTSRRGGKTVVAGYKIVREALLYPGRKFLFIGLVGQSAENAVFKIFDGDPSKPEGSSARAGVLKTLGAEHTYNKITRTFTLSNGSTIRLFGLNSNPGEQEKTLGGGYGGVVIDESQAQAQNLEAIVNEVLGPAMADYLLEGGGWIWMIGTPGEHMGNHYWFRVTKQEKDGVRATDRERGWHVHEWLVEDNPHMRAQFELDCQRDREAWGSDDFMLEPGWLRKWKCRWVLELASRVYRFTVDKNQQVANDTAGTLGRGEDPWIYTFGVDLGWEDATAVVVAAWRPGERKLYFVRSAKESHATYERVGAWLLEWAQIFKPVRIVMDSGGIGKQLAKSLAARFKLAVVPAGKTDKQDHVARMNGDLATGAIQVVAGDNKDLITEWQEHILDPKKRLEGEWAEYERSENHLCDAALYAWRDAQHYAQPIAAPKVALAHHELLAAKRKRAASRTRAGDRIFVELERRSA